MKSLFQCTGAGCQPSPWKTKTGKVTLFEKVEIKTLGVKNPISGGITCKES